MAKYTYTLFFRRTSSYDFEVEADSLSDAEELIKQRIEDYGNIEDREIDEALDELDNENGWDTEIRSHIVYTN